MNAERFKELLAQAKANQAAARVLSQQMTEAGVTEVDTSSLQLPSNASPDASPSEVLEHEEQVKEAIAEIITDVKEHETKLKAGVARTVLLNPKQAEFNKRVQAGEDIVLVGAAGTGKTTSMRKVTEDLIASGRLGKISSPTKWLQAGKPGAAILSFTRKAVNNIRHAVTEELKAHTLTVHKLLEFAPVQYEIEDPNNPGQYKMTMRFEPRRDRNNPLPPDLILLVFEETSMLGITLYNLLQDAMPHEHQEVFLGDIQQLPPVFGKAVLGFKMLELPVIELTEVYRQALNSPIINLAWKLLGGNPHDFSGKLERYNINDPNGKSISRIRAPILEGLSSVTDFGTVKLQIWQKSLSADLGCFTAIKQFTAWEAGGYYNPIDDIILCPFNKAFGTIELNLGISQYLGVQRQSTVHEVIAGFNKLYLAVGDRVLYDKEDYFITEISTNVEYSGKLPIPASKHLDRHGVYQEKLTEEELKAREKEQEEQDHDAVEKFMASMTDDVVDRVQSASHNITIRPAWNVDTSTSNADLLRELEESTENNEDKVLSKAGDLNNLLGGYAITVHKAQGCEWNKVFLVLHSTHANMNTRELLYTAVTRAKKYLHVICENNTFEKGIKYQAIKGNTLKEKALIFEGVAAKGEENMVPTPSRNLSKETIERMMKDAAEKETLPETENSVIDTATEELEVASITQETREELVEQPVALTPAQQKIAEIRARLLIKHLEKSS